MAIGQLVVQLGLDAAEFTRGLTKAEVQAQAFAKRQEQIGANIARLGSLAGLAAVAIAAGFVAMVKAQSQAIDKFNDLADATGASIENISALDRVARETGGSFDTVATSLVKFNKALSDTVDSKSDASRVFAALGLDAKALRAADPAEALRQTAVALSKFALDGDKARAVQELFGKSIRDAAPFLKDLAEQTKLTATTTTQAAEEAEKFNKELFKLSANATDFARSLTTEVVTALNAAIEKFREGQKEGLGFFSMLARESEILNFLGLVPKNSAEQLASLTQHAAALESVLAKTTITQERRLRVEGALARVQATIAGLTSKAAANVKDPFASFGIGVVPQSLKIPDKTTKTKVSEAQRYIEALEKEIERAQDLTRVEEVLKDIQAKRIEGLDAKGAGKALSLARQIDEQRRQNALLKEQDSIRESLAAQIRQSVEAGFAEAEQIAESNKRQREEIELIGATREAVFLIERARVSSAIALKEQALAESLSEKSSGLLTAALLDQIEALKERLGLLSQRKVAEDFDDAMKEAAARARELNDVLKDNFADSFGDFLTGTKSAKDAFKDFANSVINEITRIAAKNLAKSIFGDGTGAGTDWIKLLGSFLGLFGGSGNTQFDPTGTMPRASGGPVKPWANYLVGEKGPEILKMGSQKGAVLPNTRGNTYVTVENNNGGEVREERSNRGQDEMVRIIIDRAADKVFGEIAGGGRGHQVISRQYGLNRAAGAAKRS